MLIGRTETPAISSNYVDSKKFAIEEFSCKMLQIAFVQWIPHNSSNKLQGLERIKFNDMWVQLILQKEPSPHSSK